MLPAPLATALFAAQNLLSQAWQRWFIEVAKSHKFVDRGDPSTYDFTQAALTTNGVWNDLDLSSIIPKGTVLVLIRASVSDETVGLLLAFRKNGQANAINASQIRTQEVSILNSSDMIVACDNQRIIEYAATNTTWTTIQIIVRGWWV